MIVSAIFIVAFAFAYYYLRGHETPATQEALSDLNAKTLDAFKDRFNSASGQQRIILLLSPT